MVQTLTTQYVVCKVEHGVLIAQVVRPKLVSDAVAKEVEDQILNHFPSATNGVVIDCSQLTGHVTSCFVNMLVKLQIKAKKGEVQYAVTGINGFLSQVLEMTNLCKVVPRFPTLADAVAEFGEFDDARVKKRVARRQENRKKRGGGKNGFNRWAASEEERPVLEYYRSNRTLVHWLAAALVVATGFIVWSTLPAKHAPEYDRRVEKFW